MPKISSTVLPSPAAQADAAISPYAYCEQKAIRSGSTFYYSFRFLSEPQRQALTVLYAFCREMDDIVDDTVEPMIANLKLTWWENEIKHLDKKQQHPISKALAHHLPQHIPKRYFLELIAGMRCDLNKNRYHSQAELDNYCYHAASTVGLITTYILGFKDQHTLLFAKHLGQSLQLINIIRDVGEDARNGRIYLPQTLLKQYSVTETDILSGKDSTQMAQLLGALAQDARTLYLMALDELSHQERTKQTVSLIMAALYHKLLDEIERNQFAVLNQRISLTPIRKLWTAWSCYRYEQKYK